MVQVPWEASDNGLHVLTWTLPEGRVFEFSGKTDAAYLFPSVSPRFELLKGFEELGHLWANQRESATWVTPDTPARPGEIVDIYAVGLGAVSPPVRTGQPAPATPPASLLRDVSCNAFWHDENAGEHGGPAPVLFAGLAPDTVGFYQISVQLPAEVDDRFMGLTCTVRGVDLYFGGILPIDPQR